MPKAKEHTKNVSAHLSVSHKIHSVCLCVHVPKCEYTHKLTRKVYQRYVPCQVLSLRALSYVHLSTVSLIHWGTLPWECCLVLHF